MSATQLELKFSQQETSSTTSLKQQPQQSKLQRQEVAKARPLEQHQERWSLREPPKASLLSGEQASDRSWDRSSATAATGANSCTQPIETGVSHVATEVLPEVEQTGTLQERDRHQHQERSSHNRFNRNQPQLPKNIDGSDRLPWETEYRGKFDPEFEKWMARSLMQYPAFQKLMAGELQIKVRKHISAGKYDLKRRDELFIEWEAMGAGVDVGEEAYGVTAKAVSRRAKIRSALCS